MGKRIGIWMLGMMVMLTVAAWPQAAVAQAGAERIDLPLPLPDIPILDDLLETVEDVLSEVTDALPLPILGPDSFEPDNTADDANFVQLLVTDLLDTVTDLLPFLKTHNFHAEDDQDWHQFYALQGEAIDVQTFNLFPGADTHLSVYQVWDEVGLLPTVIPEGCTEAFISMDDGTILIPVACNDDANDEFGALRSKVSFIAPVEGIYYSRVTQSPKATAAKRGAIEGNTTYQYMASSQGYFGGSLHVSVREALNSQPIDFAEVTLEPLGVSTRENSNGVYSFHGIPAGQYQYRVDAPGCEPFYASTTVGEGENKFVYCALVPEDGIPHTDEEGETETEVVEGEYTDSYGSTLSPQEAHSADFDAPYGKFSVSEILRVIQFLNLGGYGCNPESEDGFAAQGERRDCNPHAADFAPQDWSIGLSEALRVIQLYNVDSYEPCPDTEDGFCLFVQV